MKGSVKRLVHGLITCCFIFGLLPPLPVLGTAAHPVAGENQATWFTPWDSLPGEVQANLSRETAGNSAVTQLASLAALTATVALPLTPTATATANPPTPTVTATATVPPKPSSTATPSATATATTTRTPSPLPTQTTTPTVMATPTITAAPTITATPTTTITPTVTATPVLTATVPQTGTADIDPALGGILVSADGTVRVTFPRGAVPARAKAEHRALPKTLHDGPNVFHRFQLEARNAASRAPITRFSQSLTVTISYSDQELGPLDPRSLRVVYFDEVTHRFVPISSTVNLQRRTVTALTDHFTDYGLGGNEHYVVPVTLNKAETDLFTGSASYQIPLEVPPGPGGLAPQLNLSYNSGIAEGMTNDNAQMPWVGLGWNLNLGYISRYEDGAGAEHFELVFNGISEELIPEANGVNYHTKLETYLKILRSGAYWEVWTKDGTYYRFGYWSDTNTSDGFDNGNGTARGVDGSRHFYSYWASDGGGNWCYYDRIYRWDVDLIRDTHGNNMNLAYQGTQGRDDTGLYNPGCGGSHYFDKSSYLHEITYSANDAGGAQRRVVFNVVPKSVPKVPYGYVAYETHQLESVEMYVSNQKVRRYFFNYDYTGFDQRLRSVREDTSDGVSWLDSFPATTFNYVDQTVEVAYKDGNGNCWGARPTYTHPRLQQVLNGYGGTATFGYALQGSFNGEAACYQRYGVATRAFADGMSPPTTGTWTYGYTGGKFDDDGSDGQSGREFRGYSQVTTTDPAGNLTVSYFSQDDYYKGKLYREDNTGKMLAKTENTFGHTGAFPNWPFVYLQQTISYDYNINGVDTQQKKTTFQYDSYGNQNYVYDWGDRTSPYRHILRVFSVNPTNWLMDRMTQEMVVDDTTGQWQSSTYYTYDGFGLLQPPGAIGELRWARKVSHQSGIRYYTVDTQYGYDSYGNRTGETTYDAEGYFDYSGGSFSNETPGLGQARTTITVYDPVYHTFAQTVTNALGQASSYTYDMRRALLTEKTDPNGAMITYQYDVFGRPSAIWAPTESYPSQSATLQYAYDIASVPAKMTTQQRRDDGGGNTAQYFTTVQFFDGLGRLVQSTSDENSGYSLTNVHYDGRGNKAWESVPRAVATAYGFSGTEWNDSSKPRLQYTFDALGRPSSVVNADGTAKYIYYSGWLVNNVDENGHRKYSIADAYGRLSQVQELRGTCNAPCGDPYTVVAPTNYAYDALDNLRFVTDAQSNVTEMRYDNASRKTEMFDPDMGHWTYAYFPSGVLQSQTDAKGNSLSFFYDKLDRLVRKESPPGTNLASYDYDRNHGSSYPLGHRTTMTDTSGITKWYYDMRGRATKEERTIDGQTYTTLSSYNAMDQLRGTTYPDNETVTNSYDPTTRLNNVSGANTYFSNATYNAQGQAKSFTLGSNIVTKYGYYGYNAAGMGNADDAPAGWGLGQFGKLWRIYTVVGGSSTVQDLQYAYDPVGNVGRIVDAAPTNNAGTVNFGYDYLDRLTSAQYSQANTYTGAYSYDAIGNLTGKTEGAVTTSYTYGPGRPHAASSVGLTTNTVLFADDFNGGSTANWDTPAGSWNASGGTLNGAMVPTSEAFNSYTYDWWQQSGIWTANHDGTYSGTPNTTVENFSAGAASWLQVRGTWAVEGGEYSNTNPPNTNWHIAQWNIPSAEQRVDYTVEVDMREVGSNTGAMALGFRYRDSNNFYFLRLSPGQISFWRALNGAGTLLASGGFTYNANQTYHVKVQVYGNRMHAWVDGLYYIGAADSSFIDGGVALFSYNGHHHFDNVSFIPFAYTLAAGQNYGNYVFQAKVQMPNPEHSPDIVVRWQNMHNFYWFDVFGGGLRLWRKANGVVDGLQSTGGGVTWGSQWHTVKIVVNGCSIQGYIDNVLYVNVCDGTFASGYSGFMALGGTNYDDVLITDIPGNTLFWDTSFLKVPNWWANSGSWRWENGEYSSINPLTVWETAAWTSGPAESSSLDVGASYEVTGREVGSNSGSFCLLFRYQNSTNYYYAQLYQGKVQLFKLVNGARTLLGEAPFAWSANTNYTLAVLTWGNELRVYVNGGFYVFAADSTFRSGKMGIGSYAGHHHFDNANFRPISQATAKNGSGWRNYRYTVKAKQSVVGSTPTIYFRWQNANNFYSAQVVGSGLRLVRTVNGVRIGMGDYSLGGPDRPANQWYTLTIEALGTNLKGSIDGVSIFNINDGTFATGTVGMSTWGETINFDDVKIEDLGNGLQPLTYDANGNLTAGQGRTIAWDRENRPSQITTEGDTTSYMYDGDGKRVKSSGPTTTFGESFKTANNNWTYNAYQTTGVNVDGQYAVRNTGTGANWTANFYRSTYALATGYEARFEFKVDRTDTGAHFALEANDATYRRWTMIANSGKIYVQYIDDGVNYIYPQDLISPVKLNTWYVAVLKADDACGFRMEVHEKDNPSISGSYSRSMPAGKAWRFHHWIWTGNAYLANYAERKVNATTVYIGNHYEKNLATGEVTKYYYANGQRIALRKGGSLNYLLADHLGSSSVVLDSAGSELYRTAYFPFGNTRQSFGQSPTDYRFTGQKLDGSTGLYYYGARYYDAALGRFLSPDTIVPDSKNPQALNRYSYVVNNPLRYTDPTGHDFWDQLRSWGWWAQGFNEAVEDALTCNISAGVRDLAGTPKPESADYYRGRTAGDNFMVVAGTVSGEANATGAVALSPSGVGMVAAGAATGYSMLVTAAAFRNGVEDNLILASKSSKSSRPAPNSASNFRARLEDAKPKPTGDYEAHHMLPQAENSKVLQSFYKKLNLDIHDAKKWGAWWEKSEHQKDRYRYNSALETWVEAHQNATEEELKSYLVQLAKHHNIPW